MKEEEESNISQESDPLAERIVEIEQVVWKHMNACEKCGLSIKARKLEMAQHFLGLARESLR